MDYATLVGAHLPRDAESRKQPAGAASDAAGDRHTGAVVVLSRDARTVTQDKRTELAALRKAFCLAVAAPLKGRADGRAEQSLQAHCHALRGDLMAMPTGTVRAINEIGDPEPKLLYGASFAEGAAVVTALIDRWRVRAR